MSAPTFKVADLELDLPRLKASRAQQTIRLRRKEWQLLVYLVEHQGQVVSRQMILDHVWSDNFDVFPSIVSVHIKYLRDKIDRPFAKQLIKTVHGWGYVLEE